MRNTLLILTLVGSFLNCFSQDKFANAIASLNSELEFKATSSSYLVEAKPSGKFVNQFEKCSDFEGLKELSELNFACVNNVKSSELFTSKWEGKWQIQFKEWEFKNEKCALRFSNFLKV